MVAWCSSPTVQCYSNIIINMMSFNIFYRLQRSTFPLYTMAAQPEGDPNDASDMLAAALEQMDDIIAGKYYQTSFVPVCFSIYCYV